MSTTWQKITTLAARHGGWIVAVAALIAIALSLTKLEAARSGVEISHMAVGTTPATVYRKPGGTGPLVVVAHGFAGSRQLMEAYSLTLADAGYVVLAFDFEGHGRNPVPMSGDVTSITGTTTLLAAETRRVLAAGRALPGVTGGAALLGHSMATDIIIRAAIAEAEAGTPVDAVVAISMFSGAVTAREPPRLLIITGEWETRLREIALGNLRQVSPDAAEGETVRADGVVRRAVVAPSVEHVGVLYSPKALGEARAFLDETFGRQSGGPVAAIGGWILLLVAGIVLILRPITGLLPARPKTGEPVPTVRLLAALFLPAILVPLVGTALYRPFLPVLVADYLMAHLAAYGLIQLLITGWRGGREISASAVLLMLVWGIGIFGLAVDHYAANFMPNAERLSIIALLALGTVPFMIADSQLTDAGRGRLWRRIAARVALLASLGLAAVLDPPRLMFLFIILPVMLLFFLVHGLMGRWVARRAGPLSAGLALGLCLAWSLGVTFPLFSSQ